MNLIQEIRQNIMLHEDPSTSDDSTKDIIINGILSEELAITLLKGWACHLWYSFGTCSEVDFPDSRKYPTAGYSWVRTPSNYAPNPRCCLVLVFLQVSIAPLPYMGHRHIKLCIAIFMDCSAKHIFLPLPRLTQYSRCWFSPCGACDQLLALTMVHLGSSAARLLCGWLWLLHLGSFQTQASPMEANEPKHKK